MGLSGKLDQVGLGDLLEVLAARRRTGRLELSSREAQAVVVLRRGRIVYAASSTFRETLGTLLVSQGLVGRDELEAALEECAGHPEQLLGACLVERGTISAETLRKVLGQQIEKVVSELVGWEHGYFELQPMEVGDEAEVEVDPREVLGRLGLVSGAGSDGAGASGLEEEADAAPERADLVALKDVTRQIVSPEFTGEITAPILDFARRACDRGALFVAMARGFSGLGQFGAEGPPEEATRRVRSLLVPLELQSLLREAAERKETRTAAVPEGRAGDEMLVATLGGDGPRQAVAIPLVVSGRALMVLYGDNPPEAGTPGPLDELELLVMEAGLVMERSLLEKRLQHYERLRESRRTPRPT